MINVACPNEREKSFTAWPPVEGFMVSTWFSVRGFSLQMGHIFRNETSSLRHISYCCLVIWIYLALSWGCSHGLLTLTATTKWEMHSESLQDQETKGKLLY